MCIICASKSGIRQPSDTAIRTMFFNNPHGAGYMYTRNGKVHIHKGFMNPDAFLNAIHDEHFTAEDSVVYHFRISTQAGVNQEMTHPFPLSNRLAHMRALDLDCACGIAHNGIIQRTTDPTQTRYSDTALFITKYLADIVRKPDDLKNELVLEYIWLLAKSKFAILDGSGYIATVGDFIDDHGLLFSNNSFRTHNIWMDK